VKNVFLKQPTKKLSFPEITGEETARGGAPAPGEETPRGGAPAPGEETARGGAPAGTRATRDEGRDLFHEEVKAGKRASFF